jgi:lipoprotein-anchoring transpeptidase ErfK/SrfK
MHNRIISRRNFLKLAALGVGGLALHRTNRFVQLPEFPDYERLGRICMGKWDVKARPDENSPTVDVLYEDAVVPWLREVVGGTYRSVSLNLRWVETPNGYIYASFLQPVRNLPNEPIQELASTSMGEGMWAEVTVPYVDVKLETTPSSNSWVKAKMDEGLPVRLYYGQVFYIDSIQADENGQILYRVNPNYYGGVDRLWVAAEAFRPITQDEIAPINSEAEDKRIVVDVTRQTMSCFEGDTEVFFCRVSTGAKFDAYGNPVDKWSTPVGTHRISRKFISLQMSGGTTGASYDLPGIGWTSIFVTGGVAIHATVWHNDFGVPRSHGCVNALPQDAKWIFRWNNPAVLYDPGMVDVSVSGESSTTVEVIES